jgi:hypothetical protein
MLYLWWRMLEEGRRRMWSLYGRFCALMLCGSCFGAVTWAVRMVNLDFFFRGNDAIVTGDAARGIPLGAASYRLLPVYRVTYAIEFLCLSTAKLMVLDRMSDFAAPRGDSMRRRWVVGGRVVMAVVVLGNAAGLAASVAAAVHSQRAADAASTFAAYFAANDIRGGLVYFRTSQDEIRLASYIASYQSFMEVVVLLLIVTAFLVAGVWSARRISSGLLDVDAASAVAAVGRTLRVRVVTTTVVLFVAFVLNSVASTMDAVATSFADEANKVCPGVSTRRCDAACYNVYTQIAQWMSYTPEFQLTFVLISSPLVLLVALWGMTNKSVLQIMKSIQLDASSSSMPRSLLKK